MAVVGAALAAKPCNGGHAWSRVSYVRGLERLGFQVVLVEQLDQPSAMQRTYFEQVCRAFDVRGVLMSGPDASGEVLDMLDDELLLVNIGGNLESAAIKERAAAAVYVDDDPGYTQFWLEAGLARGKLEGHGFFYTYGAAIGTPDCTVPAAGIDWRPLLPPVVLEDWPAVQGRGQAFTTVASWRGGYGRVDVNGHLFGQKAHEFRRFADLPSRCDGVFEIALKIDPSDSADAELLRDRGWLLVDPDAHTATPEAFRRYVKGSDAEFSTAQGIYVETRSGWFSDRTTRYLASGRPAVVQDTGFSRHLPTGAGLNAFTTVDDAVAGVESVLAGWTRHSRAAREIAEEFFDSDRVLGRLVEEVGW